MGQIGSYRLTEEFSLETIKRVIEQIGIVEDVFQHLDRNIPLDQRGRFDDRNLIFVEPSDRRGIQITSPRRQLI